jgi:hypothetical protein
MVTVLTSLHARLGPLFVMMDFGQQCENFEHMVKPVIKALRVFDRRTPAMAKAWLEMNNLKRHVFSLREPDFNLPAPMAVRLEVQFMHSGI